MSWPQACGAHIYLDTPAWRTNDLVRSLPRQESIQQFPVEVGLLVFCIGKMPEQCGGIVILGAAASGLAGDLQEAPHELDGRLTTS